MSLVFFKLKFTNIRTESHTQFKSGLKAGALWDVIADVWFGKKFDISPFTFYWWLFVGSAFLFQTLRRISTYRLFQVNSLIRIFTQIYKRHALYVRITPKDNVHCVIRNIHTVCVYCVLLMHRSFLPISFRITSTVCPKKYAHGFVVLCFVVVMQSFIMNPHEVFIHIHQGCFAGTGAIVRLPQCQWSKPDGYGKISQCITTTKHSKAKTVCIFLGIYCTPQCQWNNPAICT